MSILPEEPISHPQGVLPWGSFWLTRGQNARPSGLGMMRCLPDHIVISILSLLAARDLCQASTCSQALYCFCSHEDLWRSMTLEELQGSFAYDGSWKCTYLNNGTTQGAAPASRQCRGVYSDLLYQPWLCATTPLDSAWLSNNSLERRSNLSSAQFQEEYERPGRPVILTDAATSWPACHKWSRHYLRKAFGAHKVVVGEMDMTVAHWLTYLDGAKDEMPLYLFDKHFITKAQTLQHDFHVPECFENDLFSALGDRRPDHRWLIWGPERSGSSFHKDPNATSAWNAVVRGSKKWVLYPPHVLPPGVHASPDGADVASPVSLVEWFLKFYEQAQRGPVKPVEGVVRAGEVLFVPSGWWHLAMNLEETIAVTQNFVSRVNVPQVLKLLQSRRSDLVSGCAIGDRGFLHDQFVAALRECYPEVLEEADKVNKGYAQAFEDGSGHEPQAAFSFNFAVVDGS